MLEVVFLLYHSLGVLHMSKVNVLKIEGLSRYRIQELQYFCLQYYEWKEKLKMLDCGVKAYEITGLPKSNNISNPTESIALKREELEKNISLVESAAKQASPTVYEYIIRNVAQGIPYIYLKVPYSARQFYRIRRKFFVILDENKRRN